MVTRVDKRFVLGGLGVLAIGLVAGVAGFAATSGEADNKPATNDATATSTFAPSTPPPVPAAANAPVLQEDPLAKAFGPVEAEPYRVRTGDGDCLNVRPVPGTTFNSDPRTCVPEGFLLWLYGEPRQADGYTWRWALGEGWVATEYVVPATGAQEGFGPFEAVTVGAQAGQVTKLARVSKDGSITQLPTLPDAIQGVGDQPPLVSPDGRWAAFGHQKGYVPTLTIRDMDTGAERSYPQANPNLWSANNRLLLYVNKDCPYNCSWTVAWLDPEEGLIRKLTDTPNEWCAMTWAPDGKAVYAVGSGKLLEVALDGSKRTVASELGCGQIAVSEDGKRLVSSPFQGDIMVVDLETGAVSRVPRANQIPVGGRCGGSIGTLTTWLDGDTVIWHESYAEKGSNGITISRIDGSARKLIPFFTVSDIRRVAPGLVSFTTTEDPENGQPFPLTWLLDTATGEARPVTVGTTPTWQ